MIKMYNKDEEPCKSCNSPFKYSLYCNKCKFNDSKNRYIFNNKFENIIKMLLEPIRRIEIDDFIIKITPHEVFVRQNDKGIILHDKLLFNSKTGEIISD